MMARRFVPDLRLATRLYLGFGLMLAWLAIAIAAGMWGAQRVADLNHQMRAQVEQANLVHGWTALVQTNLERAVLATRLEAAADGDGTLQQRLQPLEASLAESMAAGVQAVASLQQQLDAQRLTPTAAQLAAAAREQREAFVKARAAIRDDIQMGGSIERIDRELVPLGERLMVALRALTAEIDRESQAASTALESQLRQAGWSAAAIALLALACGGELARRIVRSVLRPLQQATAAAGRIGQLDLSGDIHTDRRDEIGELMRALQQMQESLGRIVGQVRDSADSIRTASAEVAAGNADLSHRTEHAASNLQQTASSMEQLTGTVRHSADAAAQANQLAGSAREVARRGGEVVEQVVSTMDEIHAASSKIADIIGTIDGIAFQTNILALNAAVEAARAGEQGRGFAVVAGEVRSLAQRSADAAKEIKGLIGASVDKVASGATLVADAGRTMKDIVASVQRVSDIIGEISAASAEQSGGIGQVNAAVVQLDQMTQQNAALVEQGAAAAESLKEQAGRLAQAVDAFRLRAAA
jgi:methyl-accepting chemotaxis protein